MLHIAAILDFMGEDFSWVYFNSVDSHISFQVPTPMRTVPSEFISGSYICSSAIKNFAQVDSWKKV